MFAGVETPIGDSSNKKYTQFAELFVEQLGRDYTKIVDVPVRSKSLPDHFGHGRESQKTSDNGSVKGEEEEDTGSELDEQVKFGDES